VISSVFEALDRLISDRHGPLQLTDALEHLRQEGNPIYGVEFEDERRDLGAVVGKMKEMMERP